MPYHRPQRRPLGPQYRLGFRSVATLDRDEITATNDRTDARTEAARYLREARKREGVMVRTLERGHRWNVENTDLCAVETLDLGTLSLRDFGPEDESEDAEEGSGE